MRSVNVRYAPYGNTNNRTYSYLVPTGMEVEVGELVVVQGPNGETGEFKVVVAVSPPIDPPDPRATKYVVGTIDMSHYEAMMEHEEQRKALRAEVDRRVAAARHDLVLQMLRDKDPEFRAMHDNLKKLGG